MKEIDPKMHTAEHILNQAMVRKFGCGRCFSAHIEKKKSKCDYHFDREPADSDILQIEEAVNNIIKSDLDVLEEMMPPDEASRKYDLGRLPEGQTGDLRIVKVGDYDACPCIGPHVKKTREIGSFRIVSSDFKDGVLRIRYKLNKPA